MKHTFLPLALSALVLLLPGPLGAAGRSRSPKAPRTPIDLNAATATELVQLPRVGPAMAARILDYRKAHGPFRRPEELLNIKGIGEKAFLKLRPFVTASGRKPETAGPDPGTADPAGAGGATGPLEAERELRATEGR